jgi:hypothetical protein
LIAISPELASVGQRDSAFPVPHGRADHARHGGSGPDPREMPPRCLRAHEINPMAASIRSREGAGFSMTAPQLPAVERT